MAEVVRCPECEKRIKGVDNQPGKKCRCPFCKALFVIGETKAAKAAPAPKQAKAAAKPGPKAPASAMDEFTSDLNPYDVGSALPTHRCPNCANEMENPEATICLECGYNTMTRTWGRTVKTLGVTTEQHAGYLLPGFLVLGFILILILTQASFCIQFPVVVHPSSWMALADHESIRLWGTFVVISIIWTAGQFCLNRLVIKPKPDEVVKDK